MHLARRLEFVMVVTIEQRCYITNTPWTDFISVEMPSGPMAVDGLSYDSASSTVVAIVMSAVNY